MSEFGFCHRCGGRLRLPLGPRGCLACFRREEARGDVLRGAVPSSAVVAVSSAVSASGSVGERADGLVAEILRDGKWHASSDVEREALERGGVNGRACRRATVRLGVETRRVGFPSRGEWRLLSSAVEEEAVLAEPPPSVELLVDERPPLRAEGPTQFDVPPPSWAGGRDEPWDRIRW
jgi:hypothetical protein